MGRREIGSEADVYPYRDRSPYGDFDQPVFLLLPAMKLREVICCSTAPSSATLGTGAITIHDIQTGSQLASFKQTSSAPHSIAIIQGYTGLGGLMLAVQPDKAILNAYSFQKASSSGVF